MNTCTYSKKLSTWLQNWLEMKSKLATKSMENRFQEVLNNKDEKWNEKSHAGRPGPSPGRPGNFGSRGWGPLNQSSMGDQLRHSLTPLRALRGTVADFILVNDVRSMFPINDC